MENSRSQQQVVILDCCFSGGFAKGMKAKGNAVNISAQLGGEGRVVLTSSSSTQYSFEHKDSDLSVYTRYLVEGIESGEADFDSDGWIGIQELHDYTSRRVREVVSEMKPEFYCAREGFKILFTRAPERDPRDVYWREVDRLARRDDIVFVSYNLLDQARAWLSMQPRPDYRVLLRARALLNARRNNLGLSAVAAEEIEIAALNPHRERYQRLQQYQRLFLQESRREKTLSLATREELRRYQHELGLNDADVNRIERPILTRSVSQPLDRGRPSMPIHENAKILLTLGSVAAVVLSAAALATWQIRTPQISSQQLLPSPLSTSEVPAVPASPTQSVSPSPISDSPPAPASPSEQLTESIAASFFSQGQQKAEAKLWSEAITDFDQAINNLQLSDKDIHNYYNGRGDCYLALKHYPKAIDDYGKAIHLKTDNAISYRNRGLAYAELGGQKNWWNALKDLNQAIELDPNDAYAHLYRGSVRFLLKDYQGVQEDSQKAAHLCVSQINSDCNETAQGLIKKAKAAMK
jgi:tetratricopeptide (TPR) repeat protein